ncbi:MAG: amidohydrolase family protein [Xanthomonadales bacterium]|nr:amidohydrolase family protein [Xanthomonadales bacterium]
MKKLFRILLGCALVVAVMAAAAAGLWALTSPDPDLSGPQPDDRFLDMHVHVAGIGAGGSGCFVNQAMRDNFRFGIFLQAMGVTLDELEAQGDQLVIARLAENISQSSRVGSAVVLAMDGVIGNDGELDRELTQVYVPSDYVAEQAARYPQLHFGASINPYRPDALQRLERAHRQGAVLIKWIPAIMHIDPADPAITPFYQRLAELGLPLLSHAGQERSFATAEDQYSDPLKLELPLSLGVTVIAAHIGTTGVYEGEPSYERLLPLFRRYPNLYTEISSLTQVNKLGYLERALTVPGLMDRTLYGSDWPLQMLLLVHPAYHWPDLSLAEAKALTGIENPWDRDVRLKQTLGVPPQVFERSARLLLPEGQ